MKHTIEIYVFDEIIEFHHDELEELKDLNEADPKEIEYHEQALDFLECLSRVHSIEMSTLDEYFGLIDKIYEYAFIRFYNRGTFLEVCGE